MSQSIEDLTSERLASEQEVGMPLRREPTVAGDGVVSLWDVPPRKPWGLFLLLLGGQAALAGLETGYFQDAGFLKQQGFLRESRAP